MVESKKNTTSDLGMSDNHETLLNVEAEIRTEPSVYNDTKS